MAEEYIGINRLKEREDANKYPRRKCVRCIRYPCFSGQGIGTHAINLAAYGCKDYKSQNKIKEYVAQCKQRRFRCLKYHC